MCPSLPPNEVIPSKAKKGCQGSAVDGYVMANASTKDKKASFNTNASVRTFRVKKIKKHLYELTPECRQKGRGRK